MEQVIVNKREGLEKPKKIRREGKVPGNVFGKSLPETILIQMEEGTARKLIRTKREGSKLLLNIDGQHIPVQIKEKTMDVVTGEIMHISFQALEDKSKVNSVIHIFLKNHEKFTGQLEKLCMEIPYASYPDDMIDTITIDGDNFKTGDILKVQDIPELMSEKIELQIDVEEIVLRVNAKRRNVQVQQEE